MIAIKGKFKNGVVELFEKVDNSEGEEVLVIFENKNRGGLEGLSADELRQLVGLTSVGGDALRDTEELYD